MEKQEPKEKPKATVTPVSRDLFSRLAVIGGEVDVPIAGYLCAYSVPDGRVDAEKVEAVLKEAGVPNDSWPARPRVPDAFKTAVRSLEEEREERVEGWIDTKVSYVVERLSAGMHALARKVTGYPRGEDGTPSVKPDFTIDKDHSYRLELERAKGKDSKPEDSGVIVEWYNEGRSGDADALQKLRDRVRTEFLVVLRSIDSDRMRRYFYAVLRANGAVPFTTAAGGLWLLPPTRMEEVQRHGQVLEAYNLAIGGIRGGNVRFWPVIDTTDMRAWILTDVQADLTTRLKGLMESALTVLKGKPENWGEMLELRQDIKAEIESVRTQWSEALGSDIPMPALLDTETERTAFIQEVDGRIAMVMAELAQRPKEEQDLPEGFDAQDARRLILEVVGISEPEKEKPEEPRLVEFAQPQQ